MLRILLISIYIVIFFFTFAREYNRLEGTLYHDFNNELKVYSELDASARGIAAAIIWPLYWSAIKYDDIIKVVNERI